MECDEHDFVRFLWGTEIRVMGSSGCMGNRLAMMQTGNIRRHGKEQRDLPLDIHGEHIGRASVGCRVHELWDGERCDFGPSWKYVLSLGQVCLLRIWML